MNEKEASSKRHDNPLLVNCDAVTPMPRSVANVDAKINNIIMLE